MADRFLIPASHPLEASGVHISDYVAALIQCPHPHNFEVIQDAEIPGVITTEQGIQCIKDWLNK